MENILKLQLKTKNQENQELQEKINDLTKTISRFAIYEEKAQKLETILKEKDENLMQFELKIKEWESLFQKRLEMETHKMEEKNREIYFNIKKEKEQIINVCLFIIFY